jgi:hypothetical protein
MVFKIYLFLILLSGFVYSQSVTFDEFLTKSKKVLNINSLKSINEYFPENFVVTSYDYGDFSGDNRTDFAIAVKPLKTKSKNIYVFMFCDSANQYIPVFSDTLAYYELPIEIGFNIANQVCFITHKIKDYSWTITGYSFLHNEFSLIDFYKTDVNPVNKKLSVGKEEYENYHDLNSFIGFYSPVTLKEFRKDQYLVNPVYDLKRNIYKGFKEKLLIDKSWFSGETNSLSDSCGSLFFVKDSGKVFLNLVLKDKLLVSSDSIIANNLMVCLDRSDTRLIENKTAKEPIFREGFDDDIGRIEVNYNLNDLKNPVMSTRLGDNFNTDEIDSIRVKLIKDKNLIISLGIPLQVFNIPADQNRLGVFLSLTFRLKNGSQLTLSNSKSTADDPLTYGRLVLVNNEEYYGVIRNYKFNKLTEKLYLNGLILKGRNN